MIIVDIFSARVSNSVFEIIPISFDTINWVSRSNNEPVAIPRNCLNSPFEFLPAPSAIFEGSETALLFN